MKLRKLIFIFSFLILPTICNGSILNNSGSSSEDSISIYISSLDSLGNPTTADSFFVAVFKSNSNDVIFSDSGITSMNGIDTVVAGAGITHYYYHRAVADIDGVGATGQYSGVLIAKKNSGSLLTTNKFNFQVVDWELDQLGDSTGIAAFYSQSAIDSLSILIDSLYAILDSIQNQDDWVGNVRYSYSDSVLQLRGLRVVGNGINDTAVFIQGTGSGPGLRIMAGSSANGFEIAGGATGSFPTTGNAMKLESSTSAGLYVVGFTDGGLFQATSVGGDGLILVGGDFGVTSGYGLRILGSGRAIGIETSVPGQPAVTVSSTNGIAVELNGLNDSDLVADIVGSIRGTVIPTDTNAFGEKLATMPPYWTQSDSIGFQGQGSSLTSNQIADAVWDESQIEHLTAGTFGKYLDSEISGLSSGSGAFSTTIICYDSISQQVIPNVAVAIRNINQTALIATSRSDNLGQARFNLDADSFVVVSTSTGFIFDSYDTLIITASSIDSVFGNQFDPGQPSSPGLCRVFGYLSNIQTIAQASVTVAARIPNGVMRSGNLVISPFSVSTQTDSLGYFFLDLIPSDSLIGDDRSYEISINRSDGHILRKKISVPALPSWQLVW